MFSLFQSKNEETSIIFDIGNGTLTGAIVVFNEDQKPKFVYTIKKNFSVSEQLEPQQLELEMQKLLDEALNYIMKDGFNSKYLQNKSKKIKRVFISFSSPWFLSKTKSIKLENPKEFVITESFIQDILKKEEALFKTELKNEHGGELFEVIESSIVHSKINGYALDNSIGKNTKTFDAYIHMSVVHNLFLNKIQETIIKHTHINIKNIHLNTFPLISFTVIRDIFTKEPDFLIMDITGEITDITYVKNEIIDKTTSMPSGKNFLLRQLCKNLNVSTEIAESTLQMFLNKKLDDENGNKISELLVSSEKEWSIYLENALLELSPSLTLPSTIFLTTQSEYFTLYESFLNTPKIDQTTVFRKNLKINRLDISSLSSFYENNSGNVIGEFIVLVSLFYKKIISQTK